MMEPYFLHFVFIMFYILKNIGISFLDIRSKWFILQTGQYTKTTFSCTFFEIYQYCHSCHILSKKLIFLLCILRVNELDSSYDMPTYYYICLTAFISHYVILFYMNHILSLTFKPFFKEYLKSLSDRFDC